MNIFQNKFFLICLCVALVLCALASTFSLMGFHGLVRDAIGVITTPFRRIGSLFSDAFNGFSKFFVLKKTLIEENERLKEENEALLLQQQRAAIIEAENERLRSYLNMKEKTAGFLLTDAHIISAESENYITVFTVNRGSVNGIAVNMPVILDSGIVGAVTEVGLNWAKVTTVLETASSVGAYIPRSGAVGIVSGDYSMRFDGYCKMTYVEETSDVQPGDLVYSSGIGSIYPAGLLIGSVESVTTDEYTRTLTVTVRPAVDFSALSDVLIIRGYEENGSGGYEKPKSPLETAETTEETRDPSEGVG